MGIVEPVEVDDSLSVVLPDDVPARLKLGLGDVVVPTEIPTGFRFTLVDAGDNEPRPDSAQQR